MTCNISCPIRQRRYRRDNGGYPYNISHLTYFIFYTNFIFLYFALHVFYILHIFYIVHFVFHVYLQILCILYFEFHNFYIH